MGMSAEYLSIWHIYDHPPYFPNGFIALRVEIRGGDGPTHTEDVWRSATLEALRDMMEGMGLFCMARSPEDPPELVESWL